MSFSTEPETKNANITRTMLGIEDHGIMSYSLTLDYGGSGQSFGGYCLDTPVKDDDGKFLGRKGVAYGADTILKILETLEVSTWEKLPGTKCRVVATHTGVKKIGHLLKDKWFDPAALAEEHKLR